MLSTCSLDTASKLRLQHFLICLSKYLTTKYLYLQGEGSLKRTTTPLGGEDIITTTPMGVEDIID